MAESPKGLMLKEHLEKNLERKFKLDNWTSFQQYFVSVVVGPSSLLVTYLENCRKEDKYAKKHNMLGDA